MCEVRNTIQTAIRKLLESLEEQGARLPQVISLTEVTPHFKVLLRLQPVRPTLTPCQQDILRLLSSEDRPRVCDWILSALENQDKLWGESTVRRALASLVRTGRLVNRSGPVRGYHIPGKF